MIRIEIEGDALDLPENLAVVIEMQSPVFSDLGEINGSYIYPFNVPATDKNKRLLSHPTFINSASKMDFSPVSIYIEGVLFKTGILIVMGSSNVAFNLSFTADAGGVPDSFKSQMLNEINYDEDTLSLEVSKNYPLANYALFPIVNRNFYGDKNIDYQFYLNYFNEFFKTNAGLNRYAVTPFMYLHKLLDEIAGLLDYSLDGDFYHDDELRRLTIYNNYALDKIDNGINIYETSIDFKNHVPKISVSTFLNALKNVFGLFYVLDSSNSLFSVYTYKYIFEQPTALDWTDKINEAFNVQNEDGHGFNFNMTTPGNDKIFETQGSAFKQFIYGDGFKYIETPFMPLFDFSKVDRLDVARAWLTPEAIMSGSSPEFELGETDFSSRLMFYRGLQQDSLGGFYPLGGWSNLNFNGAEIGNYTLRWEGEDGLFNVFWKSWADFSAQAKTVQRRLRFNIKDLLAFDFKNKVHIESGQYGSSDFLIEKIRIKASVLNGIEFADATLKTVL